MTRDAVYFGGFDHHAYALSRADGHELWRYDTLDAIPRDVVVAGANVLFGSRSYSIFALDAEMATNGSTQIGSTLMTDSLAMTRSDRGRLIDRDPAMWQRVTSELRLPTGTDFAMIRLHIHRGLHSPGVTFAGHYADDVHVSLIRRAPLP